MTDTYTLYNNTVMDHFMNPRNMGDIKEADAIGEVGAAACGDIMKISLKIDESTQTVTDARFKTFGCGSAIAASSMAMPLEAQATNQVKEEIKALAKVTLTKDQYLCHNEIIYRESRWNHRAIGNIGGTKQAYGLYQMKLESLKVSTHFRQYWKYWYYVVHRYGTTPHNDANYCKALNHLISKGWQ